ncbi:MAG: PKD domain-containing protein, partial [Candidatus Heimdallarchaeota archaeon]
MNNKSLKTTGLLRLKTKIKIFLAVFSLLTVSVSLYTSSISENFDNPFFMINNDMNNYCFLAGFESQNEGTMQNHPPETPDKPPGPTFIEAGIQYTYCAFTHDPDADLIRYRFDWGDGSISNWTQLETSDIPVYMSHSWITISTFDVKVIAQDENGLNSSWSPVLSGTVSQVESIEIPPFVDKSISNFEKFIWNSNGNHWEATGINIQIAINDLRETGGTVWIPDSEITISSRIFTVDNLTLSFSGKLKLNDGDVEQVSMISCDDENVTFINPQLDMDRVNNKVNTTFGMQIAIYFTG